MSLGFLSGCVTVQASGGFSDLFIRECRCKGIFLYNISLESDIITASVKHADLHAL